jgi:type II secretory pathway component GspD/PulD (secretin)
MKRGGSTWTSLALLASLLFSTPAVADETRVIQLRNRSAAEMMPLIRPLLGPNDAVSGADYRLIVRTSNQNFREIEKLVAQLDTARRQLRISVRQTVAQERENTNVGISGEIKNDNVRIQIPRQTPPENRGVVIRRDGVQLETQQTRTTSSSSTSQFVSTLDGMPAFVRVGQSVPHVQQILALTGKQQLVLAQGVSFHDVITGFDVTPYVQGDNVRLQITPRLSRLTNPTTDLVNFQEYSTTVVVKPGDWVDIGGLSGNGQEVRRAILSSASSHTGERRTILIKVE